MWFGRNVVFGMIVMAGLAVIVSAQDKAAGKTYGDGVKLTTATPIADLFAKPADYVGKTVRVDGEVSAVCEEMGCWIELTDPLLKKGLRFKVEDGVIVFPVSAKGKKASAEGTFVKIDPATEAHAEANAAETKTGSAHATADLKAGAAPVYMVRATGAVIY